MTRAEALEHCGNSPFLDVITQRGSRFRLYRQTIESSDDGYVFGHRLERRHASAGGSEKKLFSSGPRGALVATASSAARGGGALMIGQRTTTPAERLERHAHRPIRAFLKNADDASEVEFWNLIFETGRKFDHTLCVAVHRELTISPRPVADVIGGWRPTGIIDGGHAMTQLAAGFTSGVATSAERSTRTLRPRESISSRPSSARRRRTSIAPCIASTPSGRSEIWPRRSAESSRTTAKSLPPSARDT